MTLPDSTLKEIAALPPVLRTLLEAELAAGNTIAEIGHSFPAPPAGAYFKLAQPLLSRPRASGDGIDYYCRNSSLYSGEITDAKRFYFLLEPAAPEPPPPDMNAIRAKLDAAQAWTPATQAARNFTRDPNGAVERFRRSMEIDYEKWHDGIGYDLSVIDTATQEERQFIEDILIRRNARDWRDIEALAKLDTPMARQALEGALRSSEAEIRVAVLSHAPHLVSDAVRTRVLIFALESGSFFGGLTAALSQVQDFHPPEIIDTLFRGALEKTGDGPAHFAAMLMFLHGKAQEPFEWEQRPLFLRFNTPVREDRETAFLELCAKIGEPADRFATRLLKERTHRERVKQAKQT